MNSGIFFFFFFSKENSQNQIERDSKAIWGYARIETMISILFNIKKELNGEIFQV